MVQQLFDLVAIDELIERSRGARGAANLTAVVHAHATAGATLTRSELETDGHRFHSTSGQIERARRKEADLVRAGHRVLRATWRQIERERATSR